MKTARKTLAENRKARHDYYIDEHFEAGIALVGTEVKSIRMGKVNLKDSFVMVKDGEAFVRNMHVSPYEKGSLFNRDPLRVRKLLLHKREISHLARSAQQDGMTLIPLSLYLNNEGRVKMELAICKGKQLHDKRESTAKRDADLEMQRNLKQR